MPITLPPISRRRFLGGVVATAIAPRLAWGDEKSSVDHVALLSDVHIAADRDKVQRDTCMAKNLEQACAEVTALKDRPVFALISGDLALQDGQAGDYATFVQLIKPLRAAGLPVHLMLGNHDHRERFWEGLGAENEKVQRPVADRHVSVVEGKHANWFLLDSLMETAKTPGLLGDRQLTWLGTALDARADKPAIVVAHHNPIEAGHLVPGLTDSDALFGVMRPRKQVKAFFFGHTHDWLIGHQDGIHLINLPPVAYVFSSGRPNGWVDAYVDDHGMRLELKAIDPTHAKAGQKVELRWT